MHAFECCDNSSRRLTPVPETRHFTQTHSDGNIKTDRRNGLWVWMRVVVEVFLSLRLTARDDDDDDTRQGVDEIACSSLSSESKGEPNSKITLASFKLIEICEWYTWELKRAWIV